MKLLLCAINLNRKSTLNQVSGFMLHALFVAQFEGMWSSDFSQSADTIIKQGNKAQVIRGRGNPAWQGLTRICWPDWSLSSDQREPPNAAFKLLQEACIVPRLGCVSHSTTKSWSLFRNLENARRKIRRGGSSLT